MNNHDLEKVFNEIHPDDNLKERVRASVEKKQPHRTFRFIKGFAYVAVFVVLIGALSFTFLQPHNSEKQTSTPLKSGITPKTTISLLQIMAPDNPMSGGVRVQYNNQYYHNFGGFGILGAIYDYASVLPSPTIKESFLKDKVGEYSSPSTGMNGGEPIKLIPIKGSLYSVKGYDPQYVLVGRNSGDHDTSAYTFFNTDGITVNSGADLIDKFILKDRIEDDRGFMNGSHYIDIDIVKAFIDKLSDAKLSGYVKSGDELKDYSPLRLDMNDGMSIGLFINADGSVCFNFSTAVFKMDKATFAPFWDALGDTK